MNFEVLTFLSFILTPIIIIHIIFIPTTAALVIGAWVLGHLECHLARPQKDLPVRRMRRSCILRKYPAQPLSRFEVPNFSSSLLL